MLLNVLNCNIILCLFGEPFVMRAADVVRTLRQKIIAVCRKLGIGVCLRTVVLIFCLTFFWVQLHMSDVADNEAIQILAKPDGLLDANDSMLQLVPQVCEICINNSYYYDDIVIITIYTYHLLLCTTRIHYCYNV